MTDVASLLISLSASAIPAILFKVTLTLASALVAVALAHRQRAALRHLFLLGAFAVLFALPLAVAVAPVLRIPVAVTHKAGDAGEPLTSPGNPMPEGTTVPHATAVDGPAASRLTIPSTAELLLLLWGAGCAVAACPVLVGLGQVRRLRRAALPWTTGQRLLASIATAGESRRIDVLRHEGVPGPMTCGTWRHTILLPLDAVDWAREDLRRALVHELEHIRRCDWASQCLARAICAAYWFHPLVWAAWQRFTLEAERACDDAVLRDADATQYAEQLVALAQRLSGSAKSPVLAMANRRDLATRVAAVLDARQRRGRVGGTLVAVASAVAVALVAAMASLQVVAVAQSAAAGSGAKFSVASIHACANTGPAGGRGGGFEQTVSPGRVVDNCYDLVTLITQAYQQFGDGRPHPVWTAVRWLVSGGPDWASSARYTIEATADGTPTAATMLGPMTQALLEERFKLAIHHESREVPVYELVLAKGAPRPQVPAECVDSASFLADPGTKPALPAGKRWCKAGWHLDSGRVVWENEGLDLNEFAMIIRGAVDRPVVNATGITGPVAFQFAYEPSTDFPTSALAAALKQQAGLELQPARRALDFLVIDHAERPVEGSPAQGSGAPPRFEAVSIRQCPDDTPPPQARGQRSSQGGFPTISAGRFTIECGTVERLISNAYVLNGEALTNNSPRIGDVSWWKGGPEWIRYDKFTIEASAPGVTDRAVLLGPMLRWLLEDRFRLALHRETEQAPMYALTVAKGGLKIAPIGPGGCADSDGLQDQATVRANAEAVTAGTAKPTCGSMTMMGDAGHGRWTIGGTTVADFARTLSSMLDHHVIDQTHLDAAPYNIRLEFAYDQHVPGPDKRNPRTDFPPADGPTIFAALEQQLGLKLEATQGSQGVLVIDHIEHPTPGGLLVPMRARGAGR